MRTQLAHYWSLYFVVWIQVFVAIAVFGVMAAVPRLGEQLFRPLERLFSKLASIGALAFLVAFVAVVAIRMALFPLIGTPFPVAHDEHSYLLMADTFAHGRLAFPQHPLWMSFETFHVNFAPTYSSMYPPAQGIVLAIGLLLGNPWIGVLLSVAAMSASVVWMLRAWMPARWALLGGVITICNLGIVSYWVNSYWGGAVAACGGALVLGAMPRIICVQRVRDSVLLGFGVAILANSRPYEGFIFCIPVAGWLLLWVAGRSSPPLRVSAIRVLLPVSGVLVLFGIGMAFYNWRLTGNAFLMPHSLNFRTYFRTPVFLWQRLRPPIHYHNRQYEEFYNGWLRNMYDGTWRGVLRLSRDKVRNLIAVFLWPGAFPALFLVPFRLQDRRTRFLFLELLVCSGAIFSVIYSLPHYAAPLTCVIYGLIVQGIRQLRALRLGSKPVGVGLARASVLLLFLTTGFNAYHLIRTPDRAYAWSWNEGTGTPGPAAIEQQLNKLPGKQLVIVRYSATHNFQGEWVYNHADIDNSKVVWARELNSPQNDKLLAYFKDRQTWLFEPDRDRSLIPLSDARTPSSTLSPPLTPR